MLNESLAKELIDLSLEKGADFCDIFVEESEQQNIEVQNQKVEQVSTGIDFGIGIRLIYKTEVYYGYTNSLKKDDLFSIVKTLASANSNQTPSSMLNRKQKKSNFTTLDKKSLTFHQAKYGLNQDVSLDKKIAFLKKTNECISKANSLVVKAKSNIVQKHQKVEIFNSHGLKASDDRHYLRFIPLAFVQDGNKNDTGMDTHGGLIGWELLNNLDCEAMAEEVVRRAVTSLHASSCPAGKMPVVIENGFGGVIFHEACGHLLETTSVEKKASVFHDKMGQSIANPVVSAIDDGQILNSWGSLAIDDEGHPTETTQLIKEGKLVNFLVDYVGHLKTGYSRSGSGRRQSYKYPPASRMRNTYIAPGTHTTEEMISSIQNGLYAKVMGGGSVQPGTGEFNFAALESYLIKNGKIDKAVKGATLIGTGPDVLQKISMVGNDLSLATGMCGSVSGSIPVTVGQPSIKVNELLVGGDG